MQTRQVMRVRMSSRLVSSVCISPAGSPVPSRPSSGLLPEDLVTPLATASPMVTQAAIRSPEDGGGTR